MSRDGLLPPVFSRLGAKVRTPAAGIVVFGIVSALGAALLPLSLLGDLTSIGTSLAFATVCLTVLWLRNTRPELERPFRVPLGGFHVGRLWIGWVPLAGIVLCLGMTTPVAIDVVGQALRGQVLPLLILAGYAGACTIVYFGYALRNSTLRRVAAVAG
jgi:APA family basic amino acid/polyamine antiporter